MKKYIIKRLLQLIPILFGITLLTFVLMHTSSVDAVDMMEQNTGMAWTEEQKAAAREELGLDKSVPVQYLNWVGNMLKGDMGTSYISGQPVLQMFLSKLPMTIYLTITSILLTIALSIPLGILSAVRKNKFTDYFIRILSFIGNSMPGFFVALLLMYLFSLMLICSRLSYAKKLNIFYLLSSFLVLHFSYGCGSIAGLWSVLWEKSNK